MRWVAVGACLGMLLTGWACSALNTLPTPISPVATEGAAVVLTVVELPLSVGAPTPFANATALIGITPRPTEPPFLTGIPAPLPSATRVPPTHMPTTFTAIPPTFTATIVNATATMTLLILSSTPVAPTLSPDATLPASTIVSAQPFLVQEVLDMGVSQRLEGGWGLGSLEIRFTGGLPPYDVYNREVLVLSDITPEARMVDGEPLTYITLRELAWQCGAVLAGEVALVDSAGNISGKKYYMESVQCP
jgi:hypothetical protein